MVRCKGSVAAILGCTCASGAGVVDLPASHDATLYFSSTGALANGAGEGLFIGRNSQGNTRRTLMSFDIASVVPAGSTITGATLTLHVASANEPVTNVTLHRLLESWTEGAGVPTNEGQGMPAQTGDATWLHRSFPDLMWTTPGGQFAGVPAASTAVGVVGQYTWSDPGMITDLQSWLDNPGGNFGWLLRGDESQVSTAKRLHSRTSPGLDLRPQLRVTYIPTPSAAAVGLAAGAFAAYRRRRPS